MREPGASGAIWSLAHLVAKTVTGQITWQPGDTITDDPEGRRRYTTELQDVRISFNPAEPSVTLHTDGQTFIARGADGKHPILFEELYNAVAIPLIEAERRNREQREQEAWDKIRAVFNAEPATPQTDPV